MYTEENEEVEEEAIGGKVHVFGERVKRTRTLAVVHCLSLS
jgi:hypothetical protein